MNSFRAAGSDAGHGWENGGKPTRERMSAFIGSAKGKGIVAEWKVDLHSVILEISQEMQFSLLQYK